MHDCQKSNRIDYCSGISGDEQPGRAVSQRKTRCLGRDLKIPSAYQVDTADLC